MWWIIAAVAVLVILALPGYISSLSDTDDDLSNAGPLYLPCSNQNCLHFRVIECDRWVGVGRGLYVIHRGPLQYNVGPGLCKHCLRGHNV